MIDAYHHVELNGIKYRLAESAEGDHYVESGEPLRPPNAQVVQGTEGTFQMRQDTLVWRIDDWSGGEGQIKWDPRNPNRHRIIKADPFTEPGILRPPWEFGENSYDDAEDNRVIIHAPFKVRSSAGSAIIYALGVANTSNDTVLLRLNPSTFELEERDRLSSGGTPGNVVVNPHDFATFFSHIGPGDGVYKFDIGGNFTLWASGNTGPNTLNLGSELILLGDFLYSVGLETNSGLADAIYEVSAISSSQQWSKVFALPENFRTETFVQSSNRGYLIGQMEYDTWIYELTPSTAAGPAVGSLIATLPQVSPNHAFYASGMLFVVSQSKDVYYIRPGAEYGIVIARPLDAEPGGLAYPLDSKWGATPTEALFKAERDSVNLEPVTMLDLITGASARVAFTAAYGGGAAAVAAASGSGVIHGLVVQNTRSYYITNSGAMTTSPTNGRYFALTPWHDFGVAEKKVLTSIQISAQTTPGNITISVFRDGVDSAESVLGTLSDEGNGVFTFHPGSPYEFNHLAIKVGFSGDHEGEMPKVAHVEARAAVVDHQKVWRLLLDCADDNSSGGSVSGQKKIENVKAVGDSGTVVEFKDGYGSSAAGVSTTHSVVVDSYTVLLDRPGGGVAEVILREVS